MNAFSPFFQYGASLVPGMSLFSNRNSFAVDIYSHATNRSATYAKRYEVLKPASGVQFYFCNSYVNATGVETGAGGSITIGGRVRYNGVNTQMTFGGATTHVLAPNQGVWSDPVIDVSPAMSSLLFVDSFVDAGASPPNTAALWPVTFFMQTVFQDGVTFGANLTAPGAAIPTTSTNASGFSPTAMRGMCVDRRAWGLIGDSILHGTGDISAGGFIIAGAEGTAASEFGFGKRAMQAHGLSCLSLAKPGDTALWWNTSPNRTISKQLLVDCGVTTAMVEYGTNGLTNLAALKSNANTLWSDLRSLGIPTVYQTTLIPRTASADNWKTLSQTPNAGFGVGGAREQFNDWLRSGADGGITGCIETADAVESSRNSSFWKIPTSTTAGSVTSATTNVITFTGAGWTVNQWAGFHLQITGGTGFPQTGTNNPVKVIGSNTTTTLTIAGATFAPALNATTTYNIMDLQTTDGIHPAAIAHIAMAAAVIP